MAAAFIDLHLQVVFHYNFQKRSSVFFISAGEQSPFLRMYRMNFNSQLFDFQIIIVLAQLRLLTGKIPRYEND
jgi:hypothetical protein